MGNNISQEDRQALIRFLKQDRRLTQSEQVERFEEEWSRWVGVRHSVFVNSGSSANLITLSALKELSGTGEVIVPTLTWVSDIASVLHCGFKPVFVDVNPRTLGMDENEVIRKLKPKTRAVFLTHILGYNALSRKLLDALADKKIPLIEDACESHGTTFEGGKAGSFGWISNFSFYYAHHLSTIEGGMVCTNDPAVYQMIRMMRSHGLVRESTSDRLRSSYERKHRDLDPQFIFAIPAYNVRSTELSAVIGRNQLQRLDRGISARTRNLKFFLDHLDASKYRTDFAVEGSSNYALTLVLRRPDAVLCRKVMRQLRACRVEFRRGTSGGGNQLRQPYLKRIFGERECRRYPHAEHIHFYGFYIGNYPGLALEKIRRLCAILNTIK